MKNLQIFQKNPPTGTSKATELLKKLDEAGQLDEGRKYIDVKNGEKIGIDRPHVPGQKVHGHLENGRAVNQDGSLSHGGQPFRLTRAQADAFRRAGFHIPKSRLIESEHGDVINLTLERVSWLNCWRI